jgi:sec-independent protein translocase protein TatC
MGFWQHFDELRGVAMKCLYVFFAGFIICYFFTNPYVMQWLREPLFKYLPPDQQKLYFTNLFENFLTHLKIAGYSALFLFSPYYLLQFWKFLAPGLTPQERKMVVPFVMGGSFFFVAGAAFAYFVLFPLGFKFFIEYGLPSDMPLLTIESYYGTCMKLLLLFGLAFELPVILVFLGSIGAVSAQTLQKNRKMAIIGITIVSAFVAPPDAISMLLLMTPLIAMFEASTWIIAKIELKRAEKLSAEMDAEAKAAHEESERNADPFRGESR